MQRKACSHEWHIYIANEIAIWSKRDDDKTPDGFYALGDIKFCTSCPTLFFFPYRRDLRAVEVEIVWPDEERAA